MSKPDWKDAPPWANFLAMNENGKWYWFTKRPTDLSTGWAAGGPASYAGHTSTWRQTLETRPKIEPDWNTAPEWANYLVQDRDGDWWWYEFLPLPIEATSEWLPTRGNFQKALESEDTNNHWDETLEQRP